MKIKRIILTILLVIVFAIVAGVIFLNTKTGTNWAVARIENIASNADRTIRLQDVNGLLSSHPSIGQVTIADKDGVWLTVKNVEMDWTRLALLKLDVAVNEIKVGDIDIARAPLPTTAPAEPKESSGFSIPKLIISIYVDKIDVPKIHFGSDLFGVDSLISVDGKASFAGGNILSDIAINRLDAPGQIGLNASYVHKTGAIDMDISMNEPANGMIANLLKMENRPAVDISLKGQGTIDNIAMNLAAKAGDAKPVEGLITVKQNGQADKGLAFSVAINGPVSLFVPSDYRDYIGTQTSLNANGFLTSNKSIVLDQLNLKSGIFDVVASAEVLQDGFLRRLIVQGNVAYPNGQFLTLPNDTKSSLKALKLDINYGGGATWQGKILADKITTPHFSANEFVLDLSGVSENLDTPSARHISFVGTGGLNGISTPKAQFANAIDHKISLALNAELGANASFTLHDLAINATDFALNLKGQLKNMVFDGDLTAQAADLKPIPVLTGVPVSGALDIDIKNNINVKTAMFDVGLNGVARNIKTGNEKLDQLFVADMKLSGSILRNETGFIAKKLYIGNNALALDADGRFSLQSAQMDFGLKLSDLSVLDPQSSGPVNVKGAVRGDDSIIALSVNATAAQNKLMGNELKDTDIALNVLLNATRQDALALSGNIKGSGSFANAPLVLAGDFSKTPDTLNVNGLKATIGTTRLDGDITRHDDGLLNGVLHFNAPDLSLLASLALMDGKGALNADIELAPQDGKQMVTMRANADNAQIANFKITKLDLNATLQDLFGLPLINGDINASDIYASGFAIQKVQGQARIEGQATNFALNADMQDNLKASTSGSFSALQSTSSETASDDGKLLKLATLNVSRGDVRAQLTTPATVALSGNNIDIRNFNLDANGGKLSLNGSVSDVLDIVLNIQQFPVSLANIAQPDLGAQGQLNGAVKVNGSKQNPNIDFNIAGSGLSVAQIRQFGLSPFAFNAKGTTQNDFVQLDTNVSGNGINISALGQLPVNTANKMNIDVTVNDLPLSLANSFVKGQAVNGKVTGHAKIGGTYLNPSADFKVDGQSLTAAPLARSGLAPLQLSADGSFADKVLNLQSMNLTGPKSLNLNAHGRLPLAGNGIDFAVNGSTPLSIANQFIAERGAKIDKGTATLDAQIKGSLTQPLLNGSLKVLNGEFIDSETKLRLQDINLDVALAGEKVVINSLTAKSSTGGSIDASGSVLVNLAQKLPADITLNFRSFRYTDNEMIMAILNGNVTVTGALLQDPLIGGDITIEKAEINIPSNFAGGNIIDVKHTNTPPAVMKTLERAGLIEDVKTAPIPNERPSVPQLKMRIYAANQIFIRGFGLDAEMGGEIRIIGPVVDIRPEGGFQLIRGRLDLLSQRLAFSEGQVTLVGNFDPELNFVATTEGSDSTVTITISGTAADINIALTSSPELPQDEILAQLLFKRSVGELSPFQMAQLASVAAQMAGLTNTSLMGALRANTGLDDLDVTTDAQGNTGVKAGRYINENIYLGVETGAGGSTKGTVNLDITKDLKAKGAVGSEGDSSVGLFYEKDY